MKEKIVLRAGKNFIVKKSKCNHFYMALVLNGERMTSWKRVTRKFIVNYFTWNGVLEWV